MKCVWQSVALLAGVGLAIGWLAARTPRVAPPPPTVQTPTNFSPAAMVEVPVSAPSITPRLFARPVPGGAKPRAFEVAEATNLSAFGPEILESDRPDAEKAAALLAAFPHLPAEEQAELASQLAVLTPDAAYAGLHDLMTNTATPDRVVEILMTDLLDRPVATRLGTLLEIAQNPAHAQAGDARELLAALIGGDYGTDWERWAKKISAWQAQHPEER
jgi:hypothetical protein